MFTYSLDRRAQSLLNGLPAKDAATAPTGVNTSAANQPPVLRWDRPAPTRRHGPPQLVPARAASAANGASNGAGGASSEAAKPTIDLEPAEIQFEPPPPDDDDVVQDDGSTTLPNVPNRRPPLMRSYVQAKEFALQQHRTGSSSWLNLCHVLPPVRGCPAVRRLGPRGVQQHR